jgi:hypothetical protein
MKCLDLCCEIKTIYLKQIAPSTQLYNLLKYQTTIVSTSQGHHQVVLKTS